jgi:hypothetical protein
VQQLFEVMKEVCKKEISAALRQWGVGYTITVREHRTLLFIWYLLAGHLHAVIYQLTGVRAVVVSIPAKKKSRQPY